MKLESPVPAALAAAPRADAAAAPAPPILAPGRNCWRIEHARRLAWLIDGENYFRAVREALATARQSIFILGWDIDSRQRLVPDGANDGWPEPLAELLNALCKANRKLRAYVLSWDFAMLYVLEREWMPLYKLDWRTHRRMSFRMDACHPTGGSHHQKVVVVDDAVAFVSGFDLSRSRWDTSEHRCEEPRRRNPFGLKYGPFHDVGMVVEGRAAQALGELARERWRRATGRLPRPRVVAPLDGHWPRSVTSDLADVEVAISRTEPAFGRFTGVAELRNLHLDAIAAAERAVFAENQYFTSKTIAEAFRSRLEERDGPDIAVVSPGTQSGWMEVSTMGVLRARLHRELKAADRHDRYRLFCPQLPWLENDTRCLNVHSKVFVVDDRLAIVGSANLSDRSMGLDTEVSLAIEANGEPRVAAVIAGLRDRLLAEHLGTTPDAVAAALARERRLIKAIESLHRPGERTLKAIDPPLDPTLDAIVPDHSLLDPERPIEADRLVAEMVPLPETRHGTRRRVVTLALVVVIAALVAVAWRYTPLSDLLDLARVVDGAEAFAAHPLAPAAVVALFVVAGFALAPVTALIAATTLVFGPFEGGLYALAGALASAASTYAMGRAIGRDAVRRLAGSRLNLLSRRLARRGLLAILLVRVVPVAPFTVVNAVAGASHIGWRDFLLGTVLGMLPGIALTATFVESAVAAIRDPGLGTAAVLAAVAGVAFALTWWLQRRLTVHPESRPPDGEHVG